MEESKFQISPIHDVDSMISHYKTQFDQIKQSSIEQTNQTHKRFDFNEQLQKENNSQALLIKSLKNQIASKDNEIASLQAKVDLLRNEIISLNELIQTKEKEHEADLTQNNLSHEESMLASVKQYQEKEAELNNSIATQAKAISELNDKLMLSNQLKERIAKWHNDNKLLMFKANILSDKEDDDNEKGEEDISRMLDKLAHLMKQLIEDNNNLYSQIVQYNKIEEEKRELKESQQLQELRYENGMLKHQLNQILNENVKQFAKKNETFNNKDLQDYYQTKDIRYPSQPQYSRPSSYTTDIDPIQRLKLKISDFEQRLKARKACQDDN